MDWLEQGPLASGGGKASGGGGCYHLSFRSGSRAGGACARAAHAYVTRSDKYADGDRDPAVHVESDHMPGWAEDEPREYWDAADLYERANGRLYISADFALPRGLDEGDQIALAHAFAQELTKEEQLPYTLAIHAGLDNDGQEHNPHAHLMISERQNDGIDRPREAWFRRANRDDPAHGGATKSRTFHGREWMEHARERWASLVNTKLEERGRSERVDHRSYERQGLDVEPGHHYGPAAAYMATRGVEHDRLEQAVTSAERQDQSHAIDAEIRRLEAYARDSVRDATTRDQEEEPKDSYGYGTGGSRTDDPYPGR